MNLVIQSSLVVWIFLNKVGAITSKETTANPGSPCFDMGIYGFNEWEYYNGYCYHFETVRVRWTRASGVCKHTNGSLASIHSYEELNFLRRSITKSGNNDGYWIGLRAEGLYSSLQWEDGTPVDFVNWQYPFNESSASCIYLDPLTGYFVRGVCLFWRSFICKVKVPAGNLTTATSASLIRTTTKPVFQAVCPNGWHMFGEKCYGIFGLKRENQETWTAANKKCLEMGATMVSIHSQQEQDFVTLTMTKHTDLTWIGLHEMQSTSDRAFRWTDDSPVNFTYWDTNQPNNWNNYKEECVNIRSSSPHFGKWNDAVCDVIKSSYICQIHIDPKKAKFAQDFDMCSEPAGWTKLNTSCYKLFYLTKYGVTWDSAQTHCGGFGGNLASIRSLRDTTFFRFHLAGRHDLFWIGLRNEGQHERYKWITGPVDYSNWGSGEPFEMPGEPNCVATDVHGRWLTQFCYIRHPFICEVTEDSSTVTPQASETNKVCPNSSLKWTDYGGNFCYITELDEEAPWYEAAHHCFLEGGFLASFHSSDEVNAILASIKDHGRPLYIGLGQKHDGSFGWVDGSPVDFSNWETGQPSSHTQMCVEMSSRSGEWNDMSCEIANGYVCSVSKISVNGSTAFSLVQRDSNETGEYKLGPGGIIGITFGVSLVVLLAVAIYCYLYPSMKSVSKLTELRPV